MQWQHHQLWATKQLEKLPPSLLVIFAIVFVLLGITCLRELSGRDWLVETIRSQAESVRKTYDAKRAKLLADKDASLSASKLIENEVEEQAYVRAFAELQKRTQALINIGAERISGTVRGMVDLVEIFEGADQVSEDKLRQLAGDGWTKPPLWNKAKAIDLIVDSTSYDKARGAKAGGGLFELAIWDLRQFAKEFPERLSSDTLLHFVALILGFLGAYFGLFLAQQKVELTRLLIGTVFGLLAYFAVKGGKWMVVFDLQAQGNPYNHYTVAVIAFVAGLCQDKVRDAFSALVNIKPAGTPAEPKSPSASA